MTKKYLDSLRGRYAAIAVLFAVSMLLGTITAYVALTRAQTRAASDVETRKYLLTQSRLIRQAVREGDTALEAFLLDPHHHAPVDAARASIQSAIGLTRALLRQPWIRAHDLESAARALEDTLEQLGRDADRLISLRRDPLRQYPSLGVANQVMRPSRMAINNDLAIMLREIFDDASGAVDLKVYGAVTEFRHLWTQMASNFRLYLANRFGSFSEDALALQEEGIETLHDQLMRRSDRLLAYESEERLGFEAAVALDGVMEALPRWMDGFREVRRLHATDAWRADVRMVTDTIEPTLHRIWGLLHTVDVAIEESVVDSVRNLTRSARYQNHVLWVMIGVGLIIIVAGFLLMQRYIFRPIAVVAQALEAEASGEPVQMLPGPRLEETRALMDAFSQMRRQVHERQQALEHQATHDALTGLVNRTLLQDRTQQAVNLARRNGTSVALMIMDLDHFKEVNDTLGHQVGDTLLKQVGRRVQVVLRESDTVARLGGDEFAVLLGPVDEDRAMQIATKVLDALKSEFSVEGMSLSVRASVGIAMYPEHGETASLLVQHADVAMYLAKRNQRGIAIYDDTQDDYSIGRLTLVSELRGSIDSDTEDFGNHYQPKVDLDSGMVVGMEALLRWRHPELGWIPPDQIVAVAEQTGLIQVLTARVLRDALRYRSHLADGGYELEISLNLSVYNLQDTGFVNQVRDGLSETGVPADAVTLEITEGAMMTNLASAIRTLTGLSELGVHLAVDDFGTGFSSLSYLKQLPVTELKIDRSFVTDMVSDDSDATIVRSTVDLAHNLGLRVVAEGVEDPLTLQALKLLGCDRAQGHYISEALAPADLERWLIRQMDHSKAEVPRALLQENPVRPFPGRDRSQRTSG